MSLRVEVICFFGEVRRHPQAQTPNGCGPQLREERRPWVSVRPTLLCVLSLEQRPLCLPAEVTLHGGCSLRVCAVFVCFLPCCGIDWGDFGP